MSQTLTIFMRTTRSIRNSKVIQIGPKAVLGGEAGVHKETFFSIPFFKPSVVEQFQVVLDDERHNVMLQALLKKEQATYTAISVLEGMDAFKRYVEGHDVLEGLSGQRIIV